MCVKKLSQGDKYLDFINDVYSNIEEKWEKFELKNLWIIAENNWIDKIKFEECYNNETYKEEIEKEFQEWINIWIKQIPSTIIINNETWEFTLLNENLELSNFEEIIDGFLE